MNPRIEPTFGSNLFEAIGSYSSIFPLVEPPSFSSRHGPRRNGISSAVRKMNHNTKQITASFRLAKNIKYRILSLRFCTLDKGFSETNFIDFVRDNAMSGNVVNSIFIPDKLIDIHTSIVPVGWNTVNRYNMIQHSLFSIVGFALRVTVFALLNRETVGQRRACAKARRAMLNDADFNRIARIR